APAAPGRARRDGRAGLRRDAGAGRGGLRDAAGGGRGGRLERGVPARGARRAGGAAASASAALSLLVAAGRFTGDALTARYGAATLVRVGGALAAFGLAFAVLVPQPALAMVGFALVGAGVANGFPLAISAAGRVSGASGVAISLVTTAGYF